MLTNVDSWNALSGYLRAAKPEVLNETRKSSSIKLKHSEAQEPQI